MKRTEIVVFCLSAVFFLLAWTVWRHQQGEALPFSGGSCERRCVERDPACAEWMSSQGGFPDAELEQRDREARCNGICFVLRMKNPGSTDACLAR